MQKLSKIILSSALIGAISFAAFAPSAAYAQDRQNGKNNGRGNQEQGHRNGPNGGFLHLICSPDGAAKMETMLSDVSTKTKLTAEQQVLFTAFKTSALTAQTDFADTCIIPARGKDSAGQLDLVDRMKHRQANMSAMVASMDSIMPTLEAFYDSLTDEQKAQLKPARGDRGPAMGKNKRSNG